MNITGKYPTTIFGEINYISDNIIHSITIIELNKSRILMKHINNGALLCIMNVLATYFSLPSPPSSHSLPFPFGG